MSEKPKDGYELYGIVAKGIQRHNIAKLVESNSGKRNSNAVEVKFGTFIPGAENDQPLRAERKNVGKPKLSYIALDCLEDCARVMEFGAEKYTKNLMISFDNIEDICKQSENANNVVELCVLNREDCAKAVMIKLSNLSQHVHSVCEIEEYIQKISVNHAVKNCVYQEIQKEKQKLENIKKNTDKGLNLELKNEKEINLEEKKQDIGNPLLEKISYIDSVDTESQKSFIFRNALKDVRFVDAKNDFILIITIQQKNTEESFVVSAITELDCLMILLKFLNLLSFTSKITMRGHEVVLSGRDNWRKGLPLSEILDSLLRHVRKLQSGEWVDTDSGLPHIGHIQCNAMFLANKNNIIDMEFKEDDGVALNSAAHKSDLDQEFTCNPDSLETIEINDGKE